MTGHVQTWWKKKTINRLLLSLIKLQFVCFSSYSVLLWTKKKARWDLFPKLNVKKKKPIILLPYYGFVAFFCPWKLYLIYDIWPNVGGHLSIMGKSWALIAFTLKGAWQAAQIRNTQLGIVRIQPTSGDTML